MRSRVTDLSEAPIMSREEGFLQRWSRRKQANRLAPTEPSPSDQYKEGTDRDQGGSARADAKASLPPGQSETAVPVTLPPIETIDRGTDIRPFLAAGVPQEMRRAALRRAWSADPAIRDFVGLSENFWDSTSGSGIPGFGSLTTDEARRLLEQLTGTPETPEKGQSRSEASEEPNEPATKGCGLPAMVGSQLRL